MELCVEAGLAGAIGVSNFLESHLEDIMDTASILPAVNQIEFNPYQHPRALQSYCEDRRIVVEGYCPLGKGRVRLHFTQCVSVCINVSQCVSVCVSVRVSACLGSSCLYIVYPQCSVCLLFER